MPLPNSPKILHILDHSVPLHSGYTFRSQSIFRAQRNRGWQPVVLTSPKHEQSWKGPQLDVEEIDGFRYYRTGGISRTVPPLAQELLIMTTLYRRIREVVAAERPDLLHVHSPILNALPALRIGRNLGLPVIYEIRAFWEDAAVDHGTYTENSWRYKLVQSLETWVCRQADQVAVLSRGLMDDLMIRGIPVDKVNVVANGIEVNDFSPGVPDAEYCKAWDLIGKRVVGFIGSFYGYEGLDLLIQAFARLAARQPDVTLLLVGGGDVKHELKAQIQKLGLEGRVILPGRIPHERIPGVYGLMNILAYPRRSMRLTELVTPLKPLEAMAMGKALVASDVGGHRELIRHGETGMLFPAGDVAALAESIERLLGDSELRGNLERQAIGWVRQERSWDKTTAVYREIYARSLGRLNIGFQGKRSPLRPRWQVENNPPRKRSNLS